MGGWEKCNESDIKSHVYETWGNTLYSPNASFTAPGPCASFSAWQAAGQDTGSKVMPMPPAEVRASPSRSARAPPCAGPLGPAAAAAPRLALRQGVPLCGCCSWSASSPLTAQQAIVAMGKAVLEGQ